MIRPKHDSNCKFMQNVFAWLLLLHCNCFVNQCLRKNFHDSSPFLRKNKQTLDPPSGLTACIRVVLEGPLMLFRYRNIFDNYK